MTIHLDLVEVVRSVLFVSIIFLECQMKRIEMYFYAMSIYETFVEDHFQD